ncbi:flagellar basal body P-ring formation protein FlgA [Achromobacter sp. LC458]|jgi:flagellar basal body P-ring formation protein FlgA|uniref:Flagella basal body P-ring formation protein FlgA n=1 Tax=Achromobacter spanius TaxID=217203 RepID=A0A2S5GMC5_9BURK|nr:MULTISPECIES: flagellar basal body P-ring formation chaperone FlgA [Achromobacter]AYD64290.1 flagellar basal body P-ring formation protein FlgA [Achromobacter sp. B7]MDX3986633.1 flagellar basal body P-ring formation chaperone FlgA [Achromobacter sp.]PPA74128.1 flagellar basal body P-ring formation protein FlgA [Achromobacter spanius]QYJ23731.1 flagellar basal body P-ring formation protein FlgA [Achromobacter sp. ES-001]TRM50294.1 flagellar basal body P-ring formation protein FlgA [Achromob
MKISARLLLARASGLLVLALAGNEAALAQDAASQPPEAIVNAAQDYLLEQLAGLPGQPSVAIDPPRVDRLAPCDAMSPFMPSGMKLRSRMTVGVRCNAPKPWTTYVQATVSVPGYYYVASRMIAAGQALTPDDLSPRDGDLVSLPPGAITDPQTVVGMSAAYRINAGQPVRGSSLRNAQSVMRGANVRINARGNGFVVSSEGQALDNAAPGATVQVRTASGQVVSGVVRNAGLVEIQL